MAAFLGGSVLARGFGFLLAWIGCVFVSILVHEFGHVLIGRLFGAEGHIILYSFGGLAVGSNALSNRWQRIAVSFAGPLAGFLLLAVVLLAAKDRIEFDPWPYFAGLPQRPLMSAAIRFLIWINLVWGILNLLPIWPLDGGQISKDFLGWVSRENGMKMAYGISILLAGLLAVHELYPDFLSFVPAGGSMYNALLFASLAFNSYQALQYENQRKPWESEY
jgi:Zn-dependent protease